MFLRAHPLKKPLQTLVFSAPKYRSSGHFTKQCFTRFTVHTPASFESCTTRAYHYERNSASAYPKRSGTELWTVAIVVSIAIGSALLVPLVRTSLGSTTEERIPTSQFDVADLTNSFLVMAQNTPAGRPGTLTPEQERKLREFWAVTIKVFGVDSSDEELNGADTPAATPASEAPVADGKKEKKKSKLNVFRRHKGEKGAEADSTTTSGTTTPSDISRLSISAEDDKHGQHADFKTAIANTPPEELRRAFWDMVKYDHPDALLLRFLRARKWDVEKALVMMISTMHWRLEEMHVDDDIVKNGELTAFQTKDGDAKSKKNAEDFLTQLRMGKSFLHGLDKEGRPMCFVRVKLHKAGEQTEESLERFTVYTIETARMLLRPPIDTATIVFDMTDFSMANMDYTPVKFMVKCFEANYPESLGTVLVYKAPWVFNAIWSIIRGWLDPVVAGKVHFAKNIEELSQFVPRNQIPTEQGGDEKWEYKYPEPVAGENDKMKDDGAREALQADRAATVKKYESIVLEWVRAGDTGKSLEERRKERDSLAEELRQNYWKLDPYVRARTLYDRIGVIQDGGKLDFYAEANKESLVAPARVSTSADDLD
ncbi:CRAL/TRIO domain-containing protein [Cucurbitaria berberidis CBS 394.84]|uniref:CRAL/TRIO domain-containing protein n=1 Tax=Cucurbitaria berberidis CBS 394.84 TaxID=1168544 RepID=A0A9P4GDZ5_9PLEO|nr:CRAL/TRIO domain-containing protein [Cucurbitaria berberidis CBS 394.84]KAF1843766.1 CRAL/TRIO domain-containing protein [Cucurbitaria berberidis CBS 394.84]